MKPEDKIKILIVDDSPEYSISLGYSLGSNLYFDTARTMEEAKAKIDDSVDIAIIHECFDQKDCSKENGRKFLQWLIEEFPRIKVYMTYTRDGNKFNGNRFKLDLSGLFEKPLNLQYFRESMQTVFPELNI